MLDWSQQQLADAASIGVMTVHQFESGNSKPRKATVAMIERAFEAGGIEFLPGEAPGLRAHKILGR